MTEAVPAATAPELEGKTPAAAAEAVEVKLGDKTFKVDKATAEAIAAFKDATEKAGVTTKAQLDALSAQVTKLTPKEVVKPAAEGTNYETLLFTNPEEAVRRIKAEIREELNGTLAATNAQQSFWTEFYVQNPDLKDADWLVKSILTREMPRMMKMQVPEAIKDLSDTVKGEILKLAKVQPAKDPKGEVEGANESGRTRSKVTDAGKDSPTSITDVLKARKAARRAGASGAAA